MVQVSKIGPFPDDFWYVFRVTSVIESITTIWESQGLIRIDLHFSKSLSRDFNVGNPLPILSLL